MAAFVIIISLLTFLQMCAKDVTFVYEKLLLRDNCQIDHKAASKRNCTL